VLCGAFWIAVAVLLASIHPACAALAAGGMIATAAFFRDPERVAPHGEHLAVAPADGRVTDVEEVVHEPLLDAPAWKIGIFLSIFDVHVNRAPCSGVLEAVHRRPGAFHDARTGAAARENESVTTIFRRPDGSRVAVRQIAGWIARRIVMPLEVGQAVARGERIGMIKFGSRTEVWIPRGAVEQVCVGPGDRVRGGETVVAVLRVGAPVAVGTDA
jgi:phosphatidylserine decarboxylase